MDAIREKKVLAVEGKDEVNFFDALLKHLRITGFEIHDVGGKDQFKDKLPALVNATGFLGGVEVLAVIRDADDDANATFKSIKNVLKNIRDASLELPSQMNQFSDGKPKIGIFIMPGNSDTGMLEDLCLKTVEEHPAMECVNVFNDCISNLEKPPKNTVKAKSQAFLAAMPKIAYHVGEGAQKGYWDFASGELSVLRSFMENLR